MSGKKKENILIGLKLMWKMDKWLVIYSVLGSAVETAKSFVGIFLSAYVLDGLQDGKELKILLGVALAATLGSFALAVFNSFLNKIKNVRIKTCAKKYDSLISMKTITMDYPQLDSPQFHEARARIMHDMNWGSGYYSLCYQLPWMLNSVISSVLAIGFILPLLWQGEVFYDVSAIILLLVFGCVIAFQVWYSSENHRELYRLLDDPTLDKSFFSYFLWQGKLGYQAGKDVRIYNAKNLISHKLMQDNATLKREYKKVIHNNMKAGFSSGFTAGLLQIISYLFVVLRAAAGALSIGSVVKYAGLIYRFSGSIADAFSAMEEYSVSANRLLSTLEYLDWEDILPKGTLPVEKRAFCEGGDNEYEIEFRKVSFRYPGSENYALKNVSLKLRIGERLAVVGLNGSGKTTLIKLLCRLYDPTEGEILLNGINIKKYNYEEYMSIFSVVFQDFKLFSFSLGQNVAAGVAYDAKRAAASLEKAGFGNRLLELSKGLDTCLYQNFEKDGVEISGGEAQKIALARALYKNAPFIILDEPTAALDPIAEYEVYSKFNEIVEDKTAIYISHRLSSCRFCDSIVVFDAGQLVQQGSHDELLGQQGGKYAELWTAQAQYYTVKK